MRFWAYAGSKENDRNKRATGAFLPHAVSDVLEGTLGVFANRMSKLLFNLTVEHNITNHLLAADVDMTREEYNKLCGGSVREVTSTRGMPRI